ELQQGINLSPEAARQGADLVLLRAGELAGLPPLVTAILAVGAIMAAFSTVTSLLISGAGAFSYDIYYRLLNPEATEGQRMKVAKAVTLVLATVVIVAAANPPGLIAEITAVAFALAGNTLFPVFLLGLWWDRTNKYGAIAGMSVGLFITFAALVLGDGAPLLHRLIPPTSSALIGAPLVILVMIVVSLLTPPPPEAIRQQLADKVHGP
ncbi:MAG TPA: cation acetate symporter, partial [Desulfuromonas sp.]|nr:cation acetate symporter [Desulfuromonas sp.]